MCDGVALAVVASSLRWWASRKVRTTSGIMRCMEDPTPLTIEPGVYRHTKSDKLYKVLGVALHTETNEQLVIYRPLYESQYEIFARPYATFVESVMLDGQTVPRFTRE